MQLLTNPFIFVLIFPVLGLFILNFPFIIFFGFINFMEIFEDRKRSWYNDYNPFLHFDFSFLFIPAMTFLFVLSIPKKLNLKKWVYLGLVLLGITMLTINTFRLGSVFGWGFFSWLGFLITFGTVSFLLYGFLIAMKKEMQEKFGTGRESGVRKDGLNLNFK